MPNTNEVGIREYDTLRGFDCYLFISAFAVGVRIYIYLFSNSYFW